MQAKDISVTQEAARHYYGGANVIIVGDSLSDSARKDMARAGFELLVMAPDGCVRCADEKPECLERREVLGVGAGLRAFMSGQGTERAVGHWQEFVQKCAPHHEVQFKTISGLPWQKKASIRKALIEILALETGTLSKQVASSVAEVASLRTENEQLRTDITRAARTLTAFGARHRYVQLELGPNSENIGPHCDSDFSPDKEINYSIRQSLLTDVSCLSGLRLFVTEGEEPLAEEGQLTLLLVQAVSNRVLARIDRSYDDISVGWNEFDLTQQSQTAFGDAYLKLQWRGMGQHPKLALSDTCADTDIGKPLAMQLFADYFRSMSGNDAQASSSVLADIDRIELGVAYLRSQLKELGTPAAEDCLTFDASGNWFQTHPNTSNIVGCSLQSVAIDKLRSVEVTVSLEHENAPPAAFWLVLAEEDVTEADVISGFNGDFPKPGIIGLANVQLTALSSERLAIPVSHVDHHGPANLYFCVQSVSSDSAFGWCRWSALSLTYAAKKSDQELPPQPADARVFREFRTHRFPELHSQLSYIDGRAGSQAVFDQAGYSPMVISEETGSLQTHPVADGFSATVCSGLLSQDARMISCEIETAHASAPDFIYVLAASQLNDADLRTALGSVRNTVQSAANRDGPDQFSSEEHPDVWFSIKRVPAGLKTSIALDLSDLPLVSPPERVIFGVLPVGTDVSFGWCRWHSVSVETVASNVSSGEQ